MADGSSTIATLGGIPLEGVISWSLTGGTKPNVQAYELSKERAESIFVRGPGPMNLTLDARGHFAKVSIDGLYVLGVMESSNPHMLTLRVADVRWLWPRKHVTARYNMRRRSGDHRYFPGGGGLRQLDIITDDVLYNPPSLKNDTTAWTAKDVLVDVIKRVTGAAPRFDVKGDLNSRSYPIESLEVVGPGDRAIDQVLRHLPGIDIYIDYAGLVVVYDRLDGEELSVLNRTGPEIFDHGHVVMARNQFIAPEAIYVCMVREMEVRFDSIDDGTTRTRDQRYMENVLSLPDITLSVSGHQYAHGAFLEFSDSGVLAAWGTPVSALPALTREIIRKSYLFDLLQRTYAQVGDQTDPDVDWPARINAVETHFRKTWRLNRRWVDRVISIKPQRVALLDPEQGRFAHAPVFCNYCVNPSLRGQLADPAKALFWYNVNGWADLIDDATPSPALIDVVDPEQGIIHLNFKQHPLRWTTEIYPSAVTNIPSAAPENAFNRGDKEGIYLAESHDVTVLLTMTPGYPNGIRQYHVIKKTLRDAERILGPGFPLLSNGAKGPPIVVLVPHPVTARFAWKDDQSALIEQAFGIPRPVDGEDDVDGAIALSNSLAALLVNRDEVDAVGDAVATAFYVSYAERVLGTRADAPNNALMKGSMEKLTHSLAKDGSVVSMFHMAPELPPMDFMTLVPDSVRRVILRMVQLPKQ